MSPEPQTEVNEDAGDVPEVGDEVDEVKARPATDEINALGELRAEIPCISELTPGHQYTGGILPNGMRHGKGTLVYPNKFFKYSGEWVNGEMHGEGLLCFADGGSYEGDFVKGEIQGKGLRKWPDGSSYAGEFVLGEKSGEGVHVDSAGTKYEGSWLENKRHGSGELEFSNGDSYIGDFAYHKQTGTGVLQCANGDSYDGEWLNNLQHGHGTAVWNNGDVYQGEWQNGLRHGQGRFVDGVSSVIFEGVWVEDKPEQVPVTISLVQMDANEDTDVINIEVGLPWSTQIKAEIMAEEITEVEGEEQRNYSVVHQESGRVLGAKLEGVPKDGEEVDVTLCQFRTENGTGTFLPQDIVEIDEEVVNLNKAYTLCIFDNTPGLREHEIVASSRRQVLFTPKLEHPPAP